MLHDLAAMPDRFEALFRELPRRHWHWLPGDWVGATDERFDAVGQACHLRDIEIDGYHVRFARTLSEDRPDLASLDGHRLAAERNYAGDDPLAAMAAFRVARTETVARLQGLASRDWERRATFAEYGEVSLRGLAHLLIGHDLQHLVWMRTLLAMAPAA
jgi:hypothetical protein